MLLALLAFALLAGLFYGLGSASPRRGLGALAAPPLPAADQLPGGDPSRAIAVESPAVIEDHAERWPCPVCRGRVRCEHHRVELIAGRRLRVARVRCPRCGFERDVYFVLRS
jgi:rubredoxin